MIKIVKSCLSVVAVVLLIALGACDEKDEQPYRTYAMGMMNSAPRWDDFDLVLQTLELWTPRTDAAIISVEVPWDSLLDGQSVSAYVVNNYKGLVDYYRSKGLDIWVYVDPQNGLDRANDAIALQHAAKSIADADMQTIYRRFVVVMDSVLTPEHLGLALETNLIRGISSTAIYNGVKKCVNDVAVELKNRNSEAALSVSVQVDYAWGKIVGGDYVGVEQDFADFPFLEELGLSSYPYFVYDKPSEIPLNYYSRLVEGKSLPVFVSEGGWASGSVSSAGVSFTSSPELQRQYIEYQSKLLNHAKAIALFQLTFTDIDVASLPASVPENIVYFSTLGLVDLNLNPKPALASWDVLFEYPRKAP